MSASERIATYLRYKGVSHPLTVQQLCQRFDCKKSLVRHVFAQLRLQGWRVEREDTTWDARWIVSPPLDEEEQGDVPS